MKSSTPLSIRLVPDGLIFDGEVIPLTDGADREAQMQEAVLSRAERLPELPESVRCEVGTARLTLIPSSEAAQAEALFRFVLPPVVTDEVVLADRLGPSDGDETGEVPLLLYGMERSVHAFFERTFPQVTYRHPISALHEVCRQRSAHYAHPVLFAQAEHDTLTLLLYVDQQVRLAMRYDTSSVADRVYYLLNTWRQLQLDQVSDYLLLMGQPAAINQLRARVAPYVKRTEMMVQNF